MAFTDRLHNRGSISTGYDIDNSLKFESDNAEFIENADTNSTQGNRQKGTASVWVKRTERTPDNSYNMLWTTGHPNGNTSCQVYFDGHTTAAYGQDGLQIYLYQFGAGGGLKWIGYPDMKFRDFSAWYHIVIAIDTTQAAEANRVKLYVNGVQQTINIQSMVSQNSSCSFNDDNVSFRVGAKQNTTSYTYNGYMSEFVWVDNAQLAPTAFGEFDEDTGIWKPIDVSDLTFGTQGFYLKFDDSSALGADSSGNSNNLGTLNNITAADQATDTPTNNFCTFNPLLPNSSEKEGATVFINPDAGADTNLSTIAVANGKWYAEFYASSNISGDNGMVGVAANSGDSIAGRFLGQDAWSVGLLTNGSYYINSSATSYLGTTFNQDIISVALDMDNKKVYFAKNGTWGNSGNPATGTNGIALPSAYEDYEWFIGTSLVLSTATYDGNYGGYTVISIASGNADANGYGTFEYAPPSGYYALCSKNLAEYG